MGSSYRKTLDEWLATLDVNGSVLDVGGSQLSVKNRVRSWDVSDYKIADLPDPHEGVKPDYEVDLNQPTKLAGNYENVFCLEVFEYIYNPVVALNNLTKFMDWDIGRIYVTFPSFYPTHNPIEHDSLRYMEGGIRKLAQVNDLKIAQMIPRRPETNALEQYYAAERLRAAKGYDHHFMGWIVEFTK